MKNKGKELAYLLRHDTSYDFKEGGWREVCDLVKNHGYSSEELENIVLTDDKGRYEFNEDSSLIRARQGHSIKVDVGLVPGNPPDMLYHGTSSRFIESIKQEGIKKMSRLYVHLSLDKETALNVAKRHGGSAVILEIDSKRMAEDGIKFYYSRNGYWLTEYIDWKYVKVSR